MPGILSRESKGKPLYTQEQRERRDTTVWTFVQGVLAPVQFVVFLISLALIGNYFITGDGYTIATISVILKTLVLLTIMVTGAIWEKVVFGQYLLAPAFFWEDIVSFFVIALHLAYLIVFATDLISNDAKMLLALLAYSLYLINAAQFLLKLRAARLSASLVQESQRGVVV
jgi:3-vinyl bacteriochlorophyllide hydratase